MLRQLVAIVTASALLLVGVYCVCAGGDHLSVPRVAGMGLPKPSSCHHNGESNSGHSSNPSSDHNHAGCNCSQIKTAPSKASTSLDHLGFAAVHFQLLALPFIAADTNSAPLGRVICGDLTVPMPPPTLLRLHCALIV